MKKIVSVVGMAFLVAGLSFADAGISMGGWGRFEANVANTGSDVYLQSGPSWAGASNVYGRVGVNFTGKSDNVGFNLNIDSNGGTVAIGDQAKITVKLSDMVTVQGGKIQGDVLRGKFGDLYNSEVDSASGEDNIFQRFNPQSGVLVDLNLVPGLYVGVAQDFNNGKAADVAKTVQAGVGYTIDKVAFIRAQYIGAASPTYQVAAQVLAVEKFNLDAGVKIPTASGSKISATAACSFAGIDNLDIQGRFGYTEKNIQVAGQAGYTIDGPLSVGAGVSTTGITGDAIVTKVGPFARMSYSNGYGKVGFLYTAASTSTWSIPVSLEYWF